MQYEVVWRPASLSNPLTDNHIINYIIFTSYQNTNIA